MRIHELRRPAYEAADDSVWLACAGGKLVDIRPADPDELGRSTLGDQHGKTSQLSAAQIPDLTVYLQTL